MLDVFGFVTIVCPNFALRSDGDGTAGLGSVPGEPSRTLTIPEYDDRLCLSVRPITYTSNYDKYGLQVVMKSIELDFTTARFYKRKASVTGFID